MRKPVFIFLVLSVIAVAVLSILNQGFVVNHPQIYHKFDAQPYWLFPLMFGLITLFFIFSHINRFRRSRRYHKRHNRFQ
jgi:uncharacterized membrane protein YdjX (TVP38/TMEM64 family)